MRYSFFILFAFSKIFVFCTLFFFCTLLTGCRSSMPTTQLVRDVSTDTIYLSNIEYDSIYIYHDHSMEYRPSSQTRIVNHESLISNHESLIGPDTIYIRDKSIEYRYRLLSDTLRITHRDSIPYEVTITQIKEIPRPLTFFDKLCRACFILLIGIISLGLLRLVKNPKV